MIRRLIDWLTGYERKLVPETWFEDFMSESWLRETIYQRGKGADRE